MRRLAFIAALGLAACSTPGDSGPPPAESIALAGEYRVAGVDGGEIDLPHGVTAAITGDRIDVQSDCIRFAWSYAWDGDRLTTATQPVASCRRALLPPEQAISDAFTAAETVARTPSNGLEFSGGGRSVLLFSQ